jgi:hypothetical protein
VHGDVVERSGVGRVRRRDEDHAVEGERAELVGYGNDWDSRGGISEKRHFDEWEIVRSIEDISHPGGFPNGSLSRSVIGGGGSYE